MRERTRIKGRSTVFIASLAGILVLANLLAVRFFARADLTRDSVFTLSGASVSLMRGLDDKLVVKAYFTRNLPGRFASLERGVRDVLEEYRQHSNGKMVLEFTDPTGDEEAEKTAKSLGINKMPNPDIEKDQTTIKEGYRGLSFSYGQETAAIPAVDSPVGLEYLITTTIKKVLGRKSTIGFLVGHGEPEIEPPSDEKRPLLPEEKLRRGAFRNIRANLDIYSYKQVDLKKGEADVPNDVDALVVVASTEPLGQKELYRLDQFLLRGGSLAIIVGGVDVSLRQQEMPGAPPEYVVAVNRSGLRELVATYGVELGSSLVFDSQSALYTAQCPPVPFPLPRQYPAWPVVTAFDESHPVTFRLGSLTLPYASPVRLLPSRKGAAGGKAAELAFTSGNSWTAPGESAVVEPCGLEESKTLESGVPVAVAISGTFASHFGGKEPPAVKDGAPPLTGSAKPGRLVVLGSSGLPLDELITYVARSDRRQAANNFMFVQNVLDWLTSEEDLIAVRMKNVNDPPLERGSDRKVAVAKWGNIVGVPLLFALFGIVRWRLRVRSGRPPKRQPPAAGKEAQSHG